MLNIVMFKNKIICSNCNKFYYFGNSSNICYNCIFKEINLNIIEKNRLIELQDYCIKEEDCNISDSENYYNSEVDCNYYDD